MSVDRFQPDGMVRIEENIKHYRYVPQKIYEITQALDYLNDEEKIKVMKYIVRLTHKRVTFRSLERKQSKKALFRAFKKVDARDSDL